MKHFIKKHILSMLLLLVFITSGSTTIRASESKEYIIDDAGLLTESEYDELNAYCRECSKKQNSDILIITTNDTQGAGSELYLQNFYDNKIEGSSTYNESCAILLIDMENRYFNAYSFGDIQSKLDYNRFESILDEISPAISSSDYYNAINTYIQMTDDYMATEITDDDTKYYNDSDLYDNSSDYDYSDNSYSQSETKDNANNLFDNTWVQLLIAAVIGFIVVLIMILGAGGRVTTNSHTYLSESNSALTGARDDYIRTTITKVKKPDNDSRKGGGTTSGGTTSGGNSFNSGGGRNF